MPSPVEILLLGLAGGFAIAASIFVPAYIACCQWAKEQVAASDADCQKMISANIKLSKQNRGLVPGDLNDADWWKQKSDQ